MKKVIGIDLGTTNSVVAFKTKNVEVTRIEGNDELTRSCVGLLNDELVVGKTAFNVLLEKDPMNLILSVKRLMGGSMQDDGVKRMIAETKNPFGYYKYGITELKGGTDGAVAVILGGKQFTPEQISAKVLKKLKEEFEKQEGEVSHAVITVPAYFTEKQKNATRIAANIAGFKVSRLLAEPTAAAIAYGVDNLKPGEAKTVLIYDFGGGTFDLSILNIVDGQYLQMGTGGDRWLGGDDIDKGLQEYIYKRVEKEYNLNNIHQLIEKLNPKKKLQFIAAMREKTEKAKIQLSSANSASINIISILEDENADDIDIDVIITRKEFEELIKPFIEKSIVLIDNLLKEVHYEIGMIDHVLLVGGTSCIPLVKEMLSQKYSESKILVSKKPMLAVAEGAAILAHRLQDEYECPSCGKVVQQNDKKCNHCNFDLEKEIRQSSVAEVVYTTNHKSFVEILVNENGKKEKLLFLDKQVPLPTSVTKVFKTTVNNQQIINLNIYTDVEDGEFKHEGAGYVTLDGELAKGSEIIVEFEIDVSENMRCYVYPKGQITKKTKVVLARGNSEAGADKVFKNISEFLKKVEGKEFDIEQREAFFKAAKKQIKEAEKLEPENPEHRNLFFKIDYEINNEFDGLGKLKEAKSQKEEKERLLNQATLMCDQYASLLGTSNTARMKKLIYEIQEQEDVLSSSGGAIEKLQELVKEHQFIISIFLLKVAASKASKSNPNDANLLLKKHDTIVTYFVNGNFENGFESLNEAWEIAARYLDDKEKGGFGTGITK